jgi:hypothetical protein
MKGKYIANYIQRKRNAYKVGTPEKIDHLEEHSTDGRIIREQIL